MNEADLAARVRALAQRFAALAIGYKKRADVLAQDARNAERDAATLFEAAKRLEEKR